MLVRLCSHTSPAEELARKDDLALLFSAITSWCPVHNVPWRKSAAEILMTLSRHGLTPNVVQYIHSMYLSLSLTVHVCVCVCVYACMCVLFKITYKKALMEVYGVTKYYLSLAIRT